MVLKKLALKISIFCVTISENIKNITPVRLDANGSLEGTFLNHGNGIVGIILRVDILNFKKIDF